MEKARNGGQARGIERRKIFTDDKDRASFLGSILADSGQIKGYKFLRKVPLPELVVKVSTYLDADKDAILSGNRRLKNCHARDLISFVAAKSMSYKFNDISDTLGIHPVTAGRCAEKGKKLIYNYEGSLGYFRGTQLGSNVSHSSLILAKRSSFFHRSLKHTAFSGGGFNVSRMKT